MELVNYLAELWGISLVIISLALLIKEKHLKRLFSAVETENGLFMCGVTCLVIGVAMVLAYNVWAMQWQVIITILGWASIIKGIALLFVPDMVKQYTKKAENFQYLSYTLVGLVIIGLIITYLGFTA